MGMDCDPAGTIFGYRICEIPQFIKLVKKSQYGQAVIDKRIRPRGYVSCFEELWDTFIDCYNSRAGFESIDGSGITFKTSVESFRCCEVPDECLSLYIGIDLSQARPNGRELSVTLPENVIEVAKHYLAFIMKNCCAYLDDESDYSAVSEEEYQNMKPLFDDLFKAPSIYSLISIG